jgi:hypothetical protein
MFTIINSCSKVTVIQADAADEKAIEGVCNQAIKDEGKLDVFFANVRDNTIKYPPPETKSSSV